MGSADVQEQLWGAAARDWVELQEPTGKPLWQEVLGALALPQGARILDAGCGGGGASALAAAAGLEVVGFDASEALLALAREKLPGLRFERGDLEALPFADGSFDASMALNSVQYAEDRAAAVRELARVTRPGGRVALGVWGRPDRCEMRPMFAAIGALLGPGPGGGPFALSEPGRLEALLTQAGLSAGSLQPVACDFAYPDDELFWRAQSSAGPVQRAIGKVGEAAVRAAFFDAVGPFRKDGGILLRNEFVWIMGTRPA